jgi:hypothetical protein
MPAWRLIGYPGRNQNARQFVGRSVTRPGRIAPTLNLTFGLVNARSLGRPRVFERPLQHYDQRRPPCCSREARVDADAEAAVPCPDFPGTAHKVIANKRRVGFSGDTLFAARYCLTGRRVILPA